MKQDLCSKVKLRFKMNSIRFIPYVALFFSFSERTNPAICFCYSKTERQLHLWDLLDLVCLLIEYRQHENE